MTANSFFYLSMFIFTTTVPLGAAMIWRNIVTQVLAVVFVLLNTLNFGRIVAKGEYTIDPTITDKWLWQFGAGFIVVSVLFLFMAVLANWPKKAEDHG